MKTMSMELPTVLCQVQKYYTPRHEMFKIKHTNKNKSAGKSRVINVRERELLLCFRLGSIDLQRKQPNAQELIAPLHVHDYGQV